MKKITYKGQSKILIALCNLVNELVDAVGSAGSGDMKKSVYDTDGNGIVDNAEKVNNHTVNANVPENAVFTDTTYTFSQSGSQLTLTDDDGNAQSVNVPSTDTNTTYTMSLDGSKLTLTDSDGLKQEVDVSSTDTNTTYTMSLDGSKLTLTDSDGKTQDVTLPSGDMKKSVYDTNGNGIVDNAEKVNGHTVGVNVPTDAKFTDSNTTYTLGKSDGKITLTDSDGLKQEVDVPSTDTNTTYTMTLDGSKLTLTDSDGNKQKVNLGNASVINNHEERLTLTEYMNIHNDYFAPLMDDDGHVLLDDNDNAIMVDWKYKYA